MDETLAKVRVAMRDRTPLHHVALNVAKLVEIGYNKELKEDVHAADIVGIDGMGIVLALKMNSVKSAERVAGIDLMQRVLEMCAAEGFKPYFLGAEPHVVAAAADVARQKYPGLELAGIQDGYFKPDDEAAIVEDIRRSGAHCLFVGMPTPRKERFLAKYRKELDVPFIMGVGGSFDVMAGKVQRAPDLMQRFGFEWLYRVYQEPRRMWWRYTRTNTLFAAMIGADMAARAADNLTLATDTRRYTASNGALAGGGGTLAGQDTQPRANQVTFTAAEDPSDGSAAQSRSETVKVGENSLPFRLPWRVTTEALIAAELASIVLAAQLAIQFYGLGLFSQGLREVDYILPSIICALVVGYQLNHQGLLTLNAILERQNGEWRKMLVALVQGFLVTLALGYLLQVSVDYSRGWLFSWLVMSCVLLLTTRHINRRLLRWLLNCRAIERRVAVVSSGTIPPELISAILSEPGLTFARHHVVEPGKLAATAQADTGSVDQPTADPLEMLVQKLIRDDIEEVVIVDQGLTSEDLSRIVQHVNVLPINVYVQPKLFTGRIPILGVERMRSGNLLKVSGKPLANWGLVLKNVFDFVFGVLALILLSPLFLLIAIAIRLDSKGPVFFRQRRHGFYENEIVVYKFRTMHVMEDGAEIKQAQRNDPRVTRVGWWLRRTSLDELPQLINVIRGEMSFVGPRPHALQHNEMFRHYVSRYTARHRVKPGITGLSQINGLRGECETPDKMRKRVEMDIYYIDHWSFWLDLRILILTPVFGLVGRNAY